MYETIEVVRGVTTSKQEIYDLVIAWSAIAIVMVIATRGFGLGWLVGFISSFLTVGVAFVVHELAHKITAQRMGHSAEFKKFTPALIFSIILSFFGVLFVAPGAVFINGIGITNREHGKISLAGPLSNLIMGFVAIVISFLIGNAFWKSLVIFTAFINCIIGLFNMIPFWVLDGRKVFVWNKKVYICILIMFFVLYIVIKF